MTSVSFFARLEPLLEELERGSLALPDELGYTPAMASLERIEIHGFKSIEHLSLTLRPLNVLIGANGSGKSNFIGAFGLLNQIVEENLQLYVQRAGGADALLHFGQKTTPELKLVLDFRQDRPFNDYQNGYSTCLVPSAGGGLIHGDEQCSFWNPQKGRTALPISLARGRAETGLHEAIQRGQRVAGYVLQALQGWKVYPSHDTSSSARLKQMGDIDDNAALRPDASNLAAFLYLLQDTHPESYRQIVGTIRMAAPFFSDFKLRPNPRNKQKIKLEWAERGTDAYFDAHALSDGTLRFICLATLLQQPRLPATVIIDEPELGLHPYAIVLLAGLLKSAATRTQVLVSTQSVTLVNQLDPEDIVVVDRPGPASQFRRLAEAEIATWLEGYGVGDLWEKNLIGGRPS